MNLILQLKQTGKIFNVTIGGLTENDNIEMLQAFQKQRLADLIELNLSCPNVPGNPQTRYDFEAVEHILQRVDQLGGLIPVGLKLPLYFDLIHFDQIVEIIQRHNIAFITCVNSIGNALVVDPDTEL